MRSKKPIENKQCNGILTSIKVINRQKKSSKKSMRPTKSLVTKKSENNTINLVQPVLVDRGSNDSHDFLVDEKEDFRDLILETSLAGEADSVSNLTWEIFFQVLVVEMLVDPRLDMPSKTTEPGLKNPIST